MPLYHSSTTITKGGKSTRKYPILDFLFIYSRCSLIQNRFIRTNPKAPKTLLLQLMLKIYQFKLNFYHFG